jgi:probable addiction module antidote protein
VTTTKRKMNSVGTFYQNHKDDPNAIAEYLNDALITNDWAVIAKAIGHMIRAQGVTKFANKARIRRDTLYRMFDGKRSPSLDRVIGVLLALNIQLLAKPARTG